MKRSLALLTLPACLSAQAPEEAEADLASRPKAAFWLFAKETPESWPKWQFSSREDLRVMITGELTVAAWGALPRHLRPAPEAGWALVGPKGELLLQGVEAPAFETVMKAMQATGWRSRWERLEAFLRDHPENGPAQAERLFLQRRILMHRAFHDSIEEVDRRRKGKEAGTSEALEGPESELDRDRAGELAEALRAFLQVEGWARYGGEVWGGGGLGQPWARSSSLLEPAAREALMGFEAALGSEPSNPGLWEAVAQLMPLVPAWSPESALSQVAPVPGRPWPPVAAAEGLARAFRQREDWAGLERLAARALAQRSDPGLLTFAESPRALDEVGVVWGALKVEALLWQGRASEAGEALEAERRRVGKAWPNLLERLKPLAEDDGVSKEARALIRQWEGLGEARAIEHPGLAPTLQLALLGDPAWKAEWPRLRRHEAFDAFEPGEELAWTELTAAQQKALRTAANLGPEARWILFAGDRVLDSGPDLPAAGALADRVRAQRRPRLDVLTEFLGTHPDHLEARRERLEELRSRMPHPRLEVKLLEDARRGLMPFHAARQDLKAWTPRKEAWEGAAMRVLPEVEARLRRWPETLELWQAWLDWASVHPGHPSPGALLGTLSVWKSRFRGGPGPLPLDIGAEVANRLRQGSDWGPLEAWCRAFWEGGLRQYIHDAFTAPKDPSGPVSKDLARLRARAGEALGWILPPYLEALARQGKEAGRARLLAEVQGLAGASIKSLKASPN